MPYHSKKTRTIIKRYLNRGLKPVRWRMIYSEDEARHYTSQHYEEHYEKPFYAGLIEFMTMSGSFMVIEFEGYQAIRVARALNGATDPLDAAPGTIRGDFGTKLPRNAVHASDSLESAKREAQIWFN